MTKQVNNHGLAKNLSAIFPLTDRTTNSTLQYMLNKFIDDCNYNIQQKELKKADIHAQAQEIIQNRDGTSAEGSPHFRAEDLVKLENDWNWHNDQQATVEELKTYLKLQVQALFPEEVKKSRDIAKTIEFFQKSA
jgi:hypothetical protein